MHHFVDIVDKTVSTLVTWYPLLPDFFARSRLFEYYFLQGGAPMENTEASVHLKESDRRSKTAQNGYAPPR